MDRNNITNLYEDTVSYISNTYTKRGELEPMNEAYFKESKEMKEMIKYLDRMLTVTHTLKANDEKGYTKVVNMPEFDKFNRAMESFFGFKNFGLCIQLSPSINAYTIPISFKYDVATASATKYIRMTPNGYKFVGVEYNTVIFITSGLLSNKNFNARDIMSVILHEVGHNFSFALNKGAGVFGNMNKVVNYLSLVSDYIFTWIEDYDTVEFNSNYYYNNPEESKMVELANHLKNKDNVMVNLAAFIMKPLSCLYVFGIGFASAIYEALTLGVIGQTVLRFINRTINPIGLMYQLYGYNDEKIADNFATIYGFGTEVAKFENEIYNIQNANNNVVTKIIGLIFAPLNFLYNAVDPHPKQTLRILDQMKILEMELGKECIDKKILGAITKDINNIQKELEKYYTSVKKHNGTFSYKFTKLMDKLFGGDVRELVMSTKKNVKQYDSIRKEDV